MATDEVRIPIFPLGGLVLFPHTQQLLHIFEPRYRQMTRDALEGDGVIGMVLPRDHEGPVPEPVPVYPIGCLGRITAARGLPDGRFLILLQGRTRFEILAEESSAKLYRTVRARLLPEPEFGELDAGHQSALEAARGELEQAMLALTQVLDPTSTSTSALAEQMRPLDPIQLTHALAFGLDCPAVEKQALLEAPQPLERCQQLIRLLEFRRFEANTPDSSRTLN